MAVKNVARQRKAANLGSRTINRLSPQEEQPVMPPGEDYQEFESFVWRKLPMRKFMFGQERVRDCLAVLVQEWPDDEFALAEAGVAPEALVIKDLMNSAKRHLHLAYGEKEFGFIWTIILQALLYEMIVLLIKWWREKKSNRLSLLKWQRHWRGGESE
jgi:hypothetical protein